MFDTDAQKNRFKRLMENKETANEEVAKQNVADSGRGIRKNHALCDRNLKFGSVIEYDKTKIIRYGNYIKYLIYANVIRNTVDKCL